MQLNTIDWVIIFSFFAISIAIGIFASRQAGKSFREYFLAGGKMSWWMLGLSMVATTFAADTPNLVTDIVRRNGVSGNWVWWAFALTGLLTVFVYAKLWKRSGVLTDLEFYELRYSGKPATFLRGFRAIYLGVVFNCMVMAVVILAAIKLSSILLGATPLQTVLVAGTVTVIYTLLGGLRGVILTDCFQFIVAMGGAIAAAVFLCGLPEVGGMSNLLSDDRVSSKLSLLPDFGDAKTIVPLFFIPIAVQWWSSWYPGAEPGGGGYVAQRMLGAKSESDATKATLLFTVAHYAVRPWPWILVALASLMVFPSLESLQAVYPDLDPKLVKDDIAYPAMLAKLPNGLLGLVIASLIAAFMSTISTHLNWGSSYLVHDFYRRFVDPNASDQVLVSIGRWMTVGLMLIASVLALGLESALDGFNIILQIGAGTGSIYILRWFWWRVNAFAEIAGMVISFAMALFFKFGYPKLVSNEVGGGLPPLEDWHQLIISVAVTTIGWFVATLLTRPTDEKTLDSFYMLIRPDGPGWEPVRARLQQRGMQVATDNSLATGVMAMFVATAMVYALLFGVGFGIYGNWLGVVVCVAAAIVATVVLSQLWPGLKMKDSEEKLEELE